MSTSSSSPSYGAQSSSPSSREIGQQHPDVLLARPARRSRGCPARRAATGTRRATATFRSLARSMRCWVMRRRGGRAFGRGADAAALADLGAQCALLRFGCIRHASESRRGAGFVSLSVMPFTITKAVIPVAGLGTRFLPATKAMPKEMLPVVDKPAIQYVVEEAVAAGPARRADDHRAQQDRPREPLRQGRRARGGAAQQGRRREAREGRVLDRPRRRALRAAGRPEGSRPRRAARQDARRAASRSRCCSATTSSTSATRC